MKNIAAIQINNFRDAINGVSTGIKPDLFKKGLGFLFFFFISFSAFAASVPFSFTVTAPGSGAMFDITASTGATTAITGTPTIVTPGTGYVQGEVLNIVQSGASGGTVTVTSVDSNGGVTGISLATGGSGYTTASGLSANGSARTSAGVYNTNTISAGVLVRTLWGNVAYPAGTYNKTWDGTDDQGRLVANGNYTIRVLSNDVNYTWQGVIGNTSDQMSGPSVYHGANGIFGMAFTGSNGYYTSEYNEQQSTTDKFSINDPGSVIHVLNTQQGADSVNVVTDGNYVYWDGSSLDNPSHTFVYATCVSAARSGNCATTGADSEVTFSSGIQVPVLDGQTYTSGIDYAANNSAIISGLAVQQTGNYLLVAHAGLNQLHVLNKTTGALEQTISVTSPGALATDTYGNLWMISNGTNISKYTVNSDGTLSSPIETLNSGSGATVNITASSGVITGATIAAAGQGFSPGEELIVVQSGASGGHVTVQSVNSSGGLTGISLAAGGSGYSNASGLSTISMLASAGSGATINITASTSTGAPTALTGITSIATPGQGYLQGEELGIVQPEAFGGIATVQSVNSSGGITGISLAAAGSGYTTAGSGATVDIATTSGVITGISSIARPGSGYTPGEEIGITQAGATGAMATVTSINQSGGINAVSLMVGGSGYSSATTASLSAGLYLPLTTLAPPMAIAVSPCPVSTSPCPDDTTVLVAYGGSSQQVEAYSNSSGTALWTLGMAGGYANGLSVPNFASDWSTNAKFYFSDFDNVHTLLAYAPDGSFWVGDPGNDRVVHFTSSQSPIEQIMYMHRSYSAVVDPISPTRVFGDYLEFSVDYSKSMGPTNLNSNGTLNSDGTNICSSLTSFNACPWLLVNNWGYNVLGNNLSGRYDGSSRRLFSESTVCYPTSSTNCHTYALQPDSNNGKEVLVELVAGSGIRFTGYETPVANITYSIYPDGSLRWVSGSTSSNFPALGLSMTWNEMPFTGFDSYNNPSWAPTHGESAEPAQTVATSPITNQLGPIHQGPAVYPSPITSSDLPDYTPVVVAFDNGLPPCSGVQAGCWNTYNELGYHIGGIQAGTSTWLWRTAISTHSSYGGGFPSDGAFDVGNGVQYAASRAMALGRSIFWGYYGEFWKGSETNKWNHLYDDGLMVGQFGVTGPEAYALERNVPPMMAGNAFADSLVTDGTGDGNVYLYHNDEGVHGGIHRWLITGLNTIAENNYPVSLSSTPGGLLGQYFDGTDLNNFNLKTTRVDAMVNLTTNPTGTNLTSTGNYSVRWTGYVAPSYSQTYTFYVNANSGVSLWVDNNLLISQWNNSSNGNFSATIALTAGTVYPIKLEYDNTGTSSVSLSWSSQAQTFQVVPSASLYPAVVPDTSNGISLMEGLQFESTLMSGFGATVNITVSSSGVITAATIGTAGEGYAQGQELNIIQTGASGGMVTVQSVNSSGGITGISLTAAGSGYASASGLTTTVILGSGAMLGITASSGAITGTLVIDVPGEGYTQGQELSIIQNGALGGVVTVQTVNSSGGITGINLTAGGSGYSSASGLATNIVNSMYGWSRDPVNENLTNIYSDWWHVGFGLMTYNDVGTQDVYAASAQNNLTYTLTRDLGPNSALTSWQLSGTITLDQGGNVNSSASSSASAGSNEGSYLDVLDTAGKIIARFYVAAPYAGSNTIDYICANDCTNNNNIIAQGLRPLENIFLPQPISISAANAHVTFAYGPYAPATTSVFDSTSNWQNPKQLRISFFGWNNTGSIANYNTDLQNISFLANPSVPSASAYTLTGPSGGLVNAASSNFTVTPNAAYTGTITIAPSGSGLSNPITLTFANSAVPQTFSITPTSAGTVTLTPTNNGTLTNPSARTYTATTPYALTVATAGSGYGMVFGCNPALYPECLLNDVTVPGNELIINCGVNSGATVCSPTISSGTTINLMATAASGSTFSGWAVSGPTSNNTCTSTTSPCTVTTTAATTVTANFSPSSEVQSHLPPTAVIATISNVQVGTATSFNGSGSTDSDGTITSYAWKFGDGSNGTGPRPTHTYKSAGIYTVTLTVADNQGETSAPTRATATVTAKAKILLRF